MMDHRQLRNLATATSTFLQLNGMTAGGTSALVIMFLEIFLP